MFKWKKQFSPVLLILLIFAVSFPSLSQEVTPEPVDAPTTEPALPTEAAPTEEIVTPSEVAPLPTEETLVPTEAVVEPTLAAPTEDSSPVVDATVEPTAETPELVLPTAAPATAISPTPSGNALERLLRYNPSASEDAVQEMLRSLGAVELERIPQIGVIRVMIPSSVATLASATMSLQSNSLANAAGLLGVEPLVTYQPFYIPNDPLLEYQTDMISVLNGGDPYTLNMETAWDISVKDGQGVTVAVIDTGIDIQHPEFSGRLVTGWDFYDDDNNPDDETGHGTHVAGVIGAKTNNGVGIAGMAYNAMLMPVRVCGDYGCPDYEIAAGIVYAVDRGVKVINMSLGGPVQSTTIEGAINYALARNVTVVAAAGNEGDNSILTDEISYPASYPGVISVAALNPDASVADFSNTNSLVTVAAPGVMIASTFPTNIYPYNYVYMDGTSMASPHVAGLAAMLIADGIAITPAQVRDALICGARDLNSDGYDNGYGYGLINPAASLTWNSNSNACQISQPNDYIAAATNVLSPSSLTQPVNTASVSSSADDPADVCGFAPSQTLWYKFTPTVAGLYYISTIGSNYDTLLGVYAGQPAELTELACNDDVGFATSSDLAISLNKTTTYYILIATNGAPVAAVAQLNINAALPTTLQQENAVAIRYTGTWNRVARTGANGGYINSTSDNNATASFLVRGQNLNLNRLVGPDQANMQVWIDGTMYFLDNSGAATRIQMASVPLGGGTGQWHTVIIRKDSGMLPISIDTIQGTDNTLPTSIVGTTRANDRSLNLFRYALGFDWYTGSQSNYFNGDVTFSYDAGAYIEFRTSGSAISIFRSTGNLGSGAAGSMDVYIDNVFYATVNNGALPAAHSVPFSIANLPPRERVVRLVGDGSGPLHFDGAISANQTILTTLTDDRLSSIVYSGIWTLESIGSAQSSTLSNAAGDADAYFMFTGNHFCVGYRQSPGYSDISVIVDDNVVGTIATAGALLYKKEWCTYNNSINTLTDTTHRVQLSVVPATGTGVSLDFIRPVRRTVFTNTMGYITETNPGIIYYTAYGTWASTSQRSTGGYGFQGGSARRANIGASEPRLGFNINGTGFILYTSLPGVNNTAGWEIYVDNSPTPLDITFAGTTTPYIDLWEGWNRFRPVSVGVINLGTGNHYIELRGIEIYDVSAPFVDFDGIRVLP